MFRCYTGNIIQVYITPVMLQVYYIIVNLQFIPDDFPCSSTEKRRDSSASIDPKRKMNPSAGVERVLPDLRMALGGHSAGSALCPTPPSASPTMAYTLGHHIGAGGTAIAAAASQAIAATQQVR